MRSVPRAPRAPSKGPRGGATVGPRGKLERGVRIEDEDEDEHDGLSLSVGYAEVECWSAVRFSPV